MCSPDIPGQRPEYDVDFAPQPVDDGHKGSGEDKLGDPREGAESGADAGSHQADGSQYEECECNIHAKRATASGNTQHRRQQQKMGGR